MIENEKEMTGQESLAIISGMINNARNRFSETGTLYLLWGWVVLICCLTQFISMKFFDYEKGYQVWFLTWLAVIYQFIYLIKRKRNEKVITYTDEILGFVWMAFVSCTTILVYLLIYQKAYYSIYPTILVMYGIPTFLSGIILKFKPLILGGITCWVLALSTPFVAKEYFLLLLSLAVIVAWIIPGFILRAKFKKEN